MTRLQRAFLILQLHKTAINKRDELLNSEIRNFGLSEGEVLIELENIVKFFNLGIKNLNANQLNNILKLSDENNIKQVDIQKKLTFFEINQNFHDNILQFFEDYKIANVFIDVDNLDSEFKGVQVVTRDDFNTILKNGWTGDWVLNPNNIEPKRVQIASMNETGNYPRGYYINADITNVLPITYSNPIRYRISFSNPIVINTGNRNIRFTTNPVKYIK